MTKTVELSTNRISITPTDQLAASAAHAYKLRKSFAVVEFDPAGRGRIVLLPEGAELRVVGLSRFSECFEVLYEDQLYNIFRVDLIGPWSSRIGPTRAVTVRGRA